MFALKAIGFVLAWTYAFVFWRFIVAFLPARANWLLKLAGFLACGWLADTIIYPEEWHSVFFTMAGFFFYLLLFHRGHLFEKCSVLLLFYPALVAVNYLMTDLGTRIFFARHDVTGEMVMVSPDLLAVSTATHDLALAARLLFWALAWMLFRRKLAELNERLTARMWILVDVVAACASVAIFSVVCFSPAAQSALAYPVCIAAVISSFGSMVLVMTLVEHLHTVQRAEALALERDYLEARMADETRVQRIYHDLKNHLLLLEQGGEAVKESARALRSQIVAYEDYIHSGNDFLDIIVRDKARMAREKEIDFNAVCHFADGGFIAPLDLTSIFGNALDNAIEAAGKCPKDARLITLKAKSMHESLVISFENTMQPQVSSERTTEDDAFLHGFGLENIRACVEKYGGTTSVRAEDGIFKLDILIPLP